MGNVDVTEAVNAKLSSSATLTADLSVEVQTTSSLAAEAGVSVDTIRLYADLGLIECTRLPTGLRLFRIGTAATVRAVLARRLANRGGRHTPVCVPEASPK